jgi:hypothetical protein
MKRLGYLGDPHRPGADLPIVPRDGLRIVIGRSAASKSGRRHRSRDADKLFAALDGSEIRSFGCRFDLEVYSVTDQSSGRWVQLGLRGTHEHLVTLRLPCESGILEATNALSEWLSDPVHVVDSAHVV